MNNPTPHMQAQIEHALGYHPPATSGVATQHEAVRAASIDYSKLLVQVVDNESPEMLMALDKVREAMMWANAAIACDRRHENQMGDYDAAYEAESNDCAVAERPPVTVDLLAEATGRLVEALGQIPMGVAESTGIDWMRRELTDMLSADRA